MRESEKSCSNCLHSYMECENSHLRQKCRSPEYNSPNYTHYMFREDWELGYCRFWAPNTQEENQNEK